MDANTKEEQAKYDRNKASLEQAFPLDYHRIKKKLPSIYQLLNRNIDWYLRKDTQQSQWLTVYIEELVRLASLWILGE